MSMDIKQDAFFPFPFPLVSAVFIRRPQRFLAEMVLADGTNVLAYCPNPGSLYGCLEPGSPTLLAESSNPKRKLRFTWYAVQINGIWVGTDTHFANRIIEKALCDKCIPGLEIYDVVQREVIVEGVRVDFVLSNEVSRCVVEVKSSTVSNNRVARYPDSITTRGVRQLNELSAIASAGTRVVVIYISQRNDVDGFIITDEFCLDYANAHRDALKSGVEVIALATPVGVNGISPPRVLPIL